MNRWEIVGPIDSIEEKLSQKGKKYWVVTIESGEHSVPVTIFTPPPAKGIEVKAVGKLSSYNGFAKLIDARLEVTNERDTDPKVVELHRNTDGPKLDDGLPF